MGNQLHSISSVTSRLVLGSFHSPPTAGARLFGSIDVSDLTIPTPILDRLYTHYLNDENSASFIRAVSERYTIATLERLVSCGSRVTRRAAAMALGFVGNYPSNHVLGRALHDDDRGVRILAENGIRQLWCRDGTEHQRQQIRTVTRMNSTEQYDEAIELANEMIDESPFFSEAWNQRAISLYHQKLYQQSVADCHQTLEFNAYHFGAAVGMAHCYLELSDAFTALECFRRAIKLNPNMDGVRAQIEFLQRTLEEK